MNPATQSRRGECRRFGGPGKVTNDSESAAFTLIELLVILAVLALGAMLLVPALARTQPDSRAARCLNNHRQLCRAWRMYADDNNERLPASGEGGANVHYPVWAWGWLDWSIGTDNTNTVYLADPRYSALALYCNKDARLFKCPADQYLSSTQLARGWKERVRSVSQNYYAASSSSGFGDLDYVQVTKLTGLINPKPAETWISIDEHPDSLNDGVLFAPKITQWVDLPANYHDGGASVAFADGHVEMHRWQASLLNVPVRYTFSAPSVTPNDLDLRWLRYRTPRKPGAN